MKKCIIIGNAPISDGLRGYGHMVDSYDHIIRMNNFKVEGFESDIGSRTTIWSNGIANLQGRDLSGISEVWNVNPYFSYVQGLDVIRRKVRDKINIVTLEDVAECYKELGYNKESFPHPSTGIMTIMLALKRFPEYFIDIINFNFFSNSVDNTNVNHHYWGEDKGFDSNHKYVKRAHDGDNEKAYLLKLIKENSNIDWIR